MFTYILKEKTNNNQFYSNMIMSTASNNFLLENVEVAAIEDCQKILRGLHYTK